MEGRASDDDGVAGNACDAAEDGTRVARTSMRSAGSSRSSKDSSGCATRTRFPGFAWRDEGELDDACLALMRAEICLGTGGRRRGAVTGGYGCCASEKTRGEGRAEEEAAGGRATTTRGDDAEEDNGGGEREGTGGSGTSSVPSDISDMMVESLVRSMNDELRVKSPGEREFSLFVAGTGGASKLLMLVTSTLHKLKGVLICEVQAHASSVPRDELSLVRFTLSGWWESASVLEEEVLQRLSDAQLSTVAEDNACGSRARAKRVRSFRAESDEIQRSASFAKIAPGTHTSRSGSLSNDDSFDPSPHNDELGFGENTAVTSPTTPDLSRFGEQLDIDKIEVLEEWGSGAFGTLHRGTYPVQTAGGRVIMDVAIKCTSNGPDAPKTAVQDFYQEVNILRNLSHQNILGYVGSIVYEDKLCMVTELAQRGTVLNYLKENGPPSVALARSIATGVARGMLYMHDEKNTMHRDLKADNILLTASMDVKICDFGLARTVPTHISALTVETGSYRWMAPEVISHEPYNSKADVFSFGILLWEILAGGELPYAHLNPLQAAVAVVRQGIRPEIPRKSDELLTDLMQRCWKTLPSARPRFREINALLEAQTVPEAEPTKQSKKKFFSNFFPAKRKTSRQ